MTVIVSVMGRKGGITKTTLAKNIADECSKQGLMTVLFDADSQGNATDGVNVTPQDAFRALVLGEIEWNDALFPVPASFTGDERDNLFVVPSFDGQVDIETREDAPTLIYERFQEVRGHVDIVICDCSPALTNVHTGLFFASNYVLLPTTCEYDSIISIDKTLNYLYEQAAMASDLPTAQILGIVPNRLNVNERVQQVNSGFVKGVYHEKHPVFRPLRDLGVWRKASQMKMSIHAMMEYGIYAERKDARIAYSEFLPVAQAVIAKAKQVQA